MRQFDHGAGCEVCKGSGHKGRMGIYELFEMSTELRELTFRRASTMQIAECARQTGGMVNLQDDGIRKILGGFTSPGEVLGATHAQLSE